MSDISNAADKINKALAPIRERLARPERPITGSASPRAIVTLTGILGLRPQGPEDPPSCQLDEDGTAIWRLNHGITVTCSFDDETGAAHWHLDRDDD